jgi:hypothetical protein
MNLFRLVLCLAAVVLYVAIRPATPQRPVPPGSTSAKATFQILTPGAEDGTAKALNDAQTLTAGSGSAGAGHSRKFSLNDQD